MKVLQTFNDFVNEGLSKSAVKKQIKIIDKMIDDETGGDGELLTDETLQDLERERKRLEKLIESVNEDLPTKEIDPNKFPNPATKNDPDFFKKGKEDGDYADDVVDTKKAKIPAKSLKPSQDAVYLGKALGLAIGGVSGGDLDAIISRENRILDGHHRWAATMFTNPNTKIGGSKADMKIGDLVPVLRQAGDALGNKRGDMPKGGDVNIFLATKKDIEDAIYNGLNMDPNYYNKEKSIAWYEKNKSNVLKGLKMIQSSPPPDGAPPRVDMPKIEPNQVDKVAKALSGGKIDVRPPYKKANESKVVKSFDEFINEHVGSVNEPVMDHNPDAFPDVPVKKKDPAFNKHARGVAELLKELFSTAVSCEYDGHKLKETLLPKYKDAKVKMNITEDGNFMFDSFGKYPDVLINLKNMKKGKHTNESIKEEIKTHLKKIVERMAGVPSMSQISSFQQ